jgi:hypothetical protein
LVGRWYAVVAPSWREQPPKEAALLIHTKRLEREGSGRTSAQMGYFASKTKALRAAADKD